MKLNPELIPRGFLFLLAKFFLKADDIQMLPYWVEFFEDLANVRGRSQNTVMAYRRDLELYAEFKTTNSESKAIYDFFKKKQLSARSQARLISSIRTYLKFCESRGMVAPELREFRQPKVKVSLPKPITLSQFQALLKASVVKEPAITLRNEITLFLLLGLGCRVSELIAFDLSDINETEQWIKVVGKGQKERIVPMTGPLAEKLKKYIQSARGELARENNQALLYNDRGHRPSRVDIWRWLAAWSAKAGFSQPISPHQFRHGCATALLDSGADLRSIQVMLGHSSIQTTQIYTSVSTQNMKETVDQFHPLSDLKSSET